ncbi:MAG: YkgJ family cysteine cluster protein [Fimbriiglobus sp.]|jgi:lysine-N-methylase|nr:YkgJ family cysteine cluster protein [Fimbriiglobus sp.]
MPMPVRSLPTVQNWDCHTCGDCCRTYSVRVTAEEKERILKQGWMSAPELAGQEPLRLEKASGEYVLNHTAEGNCVFLGPDNLCRIHAKFGAAAKPFACRLYPFVMVPAGDHWKVSLRYACPSVADNLGRGCAAHAGELTALSGLVEADNPKAINMPPPELQRGQVVPWDDLNRFTKTFLRMVTNSTFPLEQRLRQIAWVADECRNARFDKVSGGRLDEFLRIVSGAAVEDTPADPAAVPRPGWVGRTLLRQQSGVYLRADHGPRAGVGRRGKWARFVAGIRFAVGVGTVPRLHEFLPQGVPFQAGEVPLGELPAAAGDLLTRYFAVKVESGQFFGPTNFHHRFWHGLESLLLVFPTLLWTARLMVAAGADKLTAVTKALRIVDESFGYNGMLDGGGLASPVRAMSQKGEIPRLIAWYGR